jgi:hypothetical protein
MQVRYPSSFFPFSFTLSLIQHRSRLANETHHVKLFLTNQSEEVNCLDKIPKEMFDEIFAVWTLLSIDLTNNCSFLSMQQSSQLSLHGKLFQKELSLREWASSSSSISCPPKKTGLFLQCIEAFFFRTTTVQKNGRSRLLIALGT